MSIWLPYKANSYERQKKVKKKQQFLRNCRICGKPVNGSGHLCQSCSEYIKQMQKEEAERKDQP